MARKHLPPSFLDSAPRFKRRQCPLKESAKQNLNTRYDAAFALLPCTYHVAKFIFIMLKKLVMTCFKLIVIKAGDFF
jgi:hypothetical protein